MGVSTAASTAAIVVVAIGVTMYVTTAAVDPSTVAAIVVGVTMVVV